VGRDGWVDWLSPLPYPVEGVVDGAAFTCVAGGTHGASQFGPEADVTTTGTQIARVLSEARKVTRTPQPARPLGSSDSTVKLCGVGSSNRGSQGPVDLAV